MRLLPFALLGAALLLAACEKRDAVEILQPPSTPADIPKVCWALPAFTLTAQNGQPLHSIDLAGKVWVADFFYVSCPGPCPLVTSHFGEVQKELSDVPDVRFVSISVDPAKDSTDVLKAYADRFKAGQNWFFCTGEKSAIYTLAHDGFKLPIAEGTPEGGPITHTTRLILVDKTGTVRGFYEGTTTDGGRDLVRDIRRLREEK